MCSWPPRAGFSLLELLVVMAITVLLTGLMLPALAHVRENAHRVVCSSNLRQIGLGIVMFAGDNEDYIPPSKFSDQPGMKQEMIMLFDDEDGTWDGLGFLYSRHYVDASACFYCQSHHGNHPFERYQDEFLHVGEETIYGNYHYRGHLDWTTTPVRRYRLGESFDEETVLVTDSLRSKRDFNHLTGMNVLTMNGSVHWYDDLTREVYSLLPDDESLYPDDDELYEQIWAKINGPPSSY